MCPGQLCNRPDYDALFMSDRSPKFVALVVDDDPASTTLAAEALAREGITAVVAATADAARAVLAQRTVDLIVLDLGLPDDNGLTLLSEVRETAATPVIIVSGFGDLEDRVVGLRLGADDYLVKPFSPSELAARSAAVMRRAVGAGPEVQALEFDDGLRIDLLAREVTRSGEVVELRPREFDVLVELASNPRRVFTREDLLRAVWKSSSEWQTPATVTEHVRKLRLAVEPTSDPPRHIITVRGVGYRFDP